jgi:hypothetical protein
LIELKLMESPWAYGVMAVAILLDSCLLYVFFKVQRPAARTREALRAPLTAGSPGGR